MKSHNELCSDSHYFASTSIELAQNKLKHCIYFNVIWKLKGRVRDFKDTGQKPKN